jgi:hypothetical protein
MKSFLALLWLWPLTAAWGQPTFSKTFSNYPLSPENSIDVVEVVDGFVFLSWSECFGQDDKDCAMLSKVDAQGNIKWFKQYPFRPGAPNTWSIYDNKIFISGHTQEADQQYVLYCLDLNGAVLWHQFFGNEDLMEEFPKLSINSQGDILLCGNIEAEASGGTRKWVYLVETDTTGILRDTQTLALQYSQLLGNRAFEAIDGQILLAYNACLQSCFVEFIGGVISLDTTGQLLWNLEFPPTIQPNRTRVVQADSNLLIANWHSQSQLPQHDAQPPALYFFDTYGQIDSFLSFENQGLKRIADLEALWGKGVVGCGRSYVDQTNGTELTGWLFRVGADRKVIWDRMYNDTTSQGLGAWLQSVSPTRDGGFVATGTVDNYMTGVLESHNWILKLDSLGCLQPGCTEINYVTQTSEALFLQAAGVTVWPNPASQWLRVAFPPGFEHEPQDRLLLLSAEGRLLRQVPAQGDVEQVLLPPELPQGVFYLVLQRGNEVVFSKRLLRM